MNTELKSLKTLLEGAGRKQRFHSYTLEPREDGPDLKMMKRHSKVLRRVLNKVRHKKAEQQSKFTFEKFQL